VRGAVAIVLVVLLATGSGCARGSTKVSLGMMGVGLGVIAVGVGMDQAGVGVDESSDAHGPGPSLFVFALGGAVLLVSGVAFLFAAATEPRDPPRQGE
jgi:hypothetical protein